MGRRLSIVLGALLLVASVAVPAFAQEATPAMDQVALGQCTIEPRSLESLVPLATPGAQPVDMSAPPATPGVPFGAPDGEPADPETVAAFTEIVRQSWACLDAGDWPRFFATLTDEEIQQNFSPEDILTLGAPSMEGQEGPLQAGQTALIAVLAVERLPDGRVGGFVIVDTAGDPLPVEINYMIALETDEGLKLDDFICFGAEGGLC